MYFDYTESLTFLKTTKYAYSMDCHDRVPCKMSDLESTLFNAVIIFEKN